MGLLGEAKLFWEKEKVTRTLEKEGEGVGASCVCVYITAWNTIRYIHVCSCLCTKHGSTHRSHKYLGIHLFSVHPF